VTCAGDGATAIAALANADFDAIILDLIMPDVDGFTVLERLRATKPHLLHRVIVTTGIPEKYAVDLESTGICGVIRKPIAVRDLEGHLARCASLSVFEAGGESPSMS